jgi:hypothetical protein
MPAIRMNFALNFLVLGVTCFRERILVTCGRERCGNQIARQSRLPPALRGN